MSLQNSAIDRNQDSYRPMPRAVSASSVLWMQTEKRHIAQPFFTDALPSFSIIIIISSFSQYKYSWLVGFFLITALIARVAGAILIVPEPKHISSSKPHYYAGRFSYWYLSATRRFGERTKLRTHPSISVRTTVPHHSQKSASRLSLAA